MTRRLRPTLPGPRSTGAHSAGSSSAGSSSAGSSSAAPRRAALGVVAVVALLALAACTGSPAPSPSGGSSDHASTPPAQAIRPTPDQSPAPTAPPIPAYFSIGCPALVPSAVLASVAPGLSAVTAPSGFDVLPAMRDKPELTAFSLPRDALTSPTPEALAAATTAGYFSCRWTGPALGIRVSLLPDGTDGFAAYRASLSQSVLLPKVAVGDDSFGSCGTGPDGAYCRLDVLKGTSWIGVELLSGTGTIDKAAYRVKLAGLARAVVASVEAVGAVPTALTTPHAPFSGVDSCDPIADAVATALPGARNTQGKPAALTTVGAGDPLVVAAAGLGGWVCAGFGLPTGPTVRVVPGAASWAWPLDLALPIKHTDLAVAGVTAARWFCDPTVETGGCWLSGTVHSALITVLGLHDERDFVRVLAAIAAASAG